MTSTSRWTSYCTSARVVKAESGKFVGKDMERIVTAGNQTITLL